MGNHFCTEKRGADSCTQSGYKTLQQINIFSQAQNGATKPLNVCKAPLKTSEFTVCIPEHL